MPHDHDHELRPHHGLDFQPTDLDLAHALAEFFVAAP